LVGFGAGVKRKKGLWLLEGSEGDFKDREKDDGYQYSEEAFMF
jgi:hypothetical protein